ncbi:MAG: hypothetical protein IJ206_09230 [Oscillospiraceae bacterium]|nr:hypothetical protein [Oscillospiraceae bacterium]
MTELRKTYKSLNKLKAATIDLVNEATCDLKQDRNLVHTVLSQYTARFDSVPNPDGECADEFPALVLALVNLDPGKLFLRFSGSQLWVENGTYGKKTVKRYNWETWKNRDALKRLGLRFSPNYEAWYYNRGLALARDAREGAAVC